jgi:hypothetical protein
MRFVLKFGLVNICKLMTTVPSSKKHLRKISYSYYFASVLQLTVISFINSSINYGKKLEPTFN